MKWVKWFYRLSFSTSALIMSMLLLQLSKLMVKVAQPMQEMGNEALKEVHEEMHNDAI